MVCFLLTYRNGNTLNQFCTPWQHYNAVDWNILKLHKWELTPPGRIPDTRDMMMNDFSDVAITFSASLMILSLWDPDDASAHFDTCTDWESVREFTLWRDRVLTSYKCDPNTKTRLSSVFVYELLLLYW